MNDDERACPECAETIKKAASVCKHCGHRFRSASVADGPRDEAEEKVSKYSKIGCALVLVVLVALVSFCTPDAPERKAGSGVAPTASDAKEDPFDDASTQTLWMIKSKDAIKGRLNDPDSAEFRKVRFYSGGTTPVVCGEVNAKNGFGGYTGFQRFIASGDNQSIAFLASDIAEGDSLDYAWDKLCIRAERDEAYEP